MINFKILLSNLTLLVMAEIILLIGCRSPIHENPISTVQPDPTKQIMSYGLPFVEKWRKSVLTFNSIIVTSENHIVLANDYRGGENIIVMDAQTGDAIIEGENISSIDSLATDNERIYVGKVMDVQAYDLETGQLVWTGIPQPKFKRGGFKVYLKDKHLEVYDSYNGQIYLLDAQTGHTIEQFQHSLPYFKQANIFYSGICGTPKMNCLSATNMLDDVSLWSYVFEDGIYGWPIFIDETMYVHDREYLYAINSKMGDLVWQTQANIVSNIVLSEGIIYGIRNDASITAYDPMTGNLVGTIVVSPDIALGTNNAGYTTFYTIAASNQFLVAYYGNSQELIVFEKVDDVHDSR